MKVLFIGGTGNISLQCSKLALQKGMDLYLLNRGESFDNPSGAKQIIADINDTHTVNNMLQHHSFDVIVNWIIYHKDEIKRDYQLFKDKTKQYIFISSASCYQKPPKTPFITEETPLDNPFWEYSRNKIACENYLFELHNKHGFPVTIVRPSHTYDKILPFAIGGGTDYTTIERIKKGKEIIIHGDGTSLWTLTHSKDFAKGFTALLGNANTLGNSYHITSDENLTWNQIYRTVASAVGCEANIVHIPSDFIEQQSDYLKGHLSGDKAHSVIFDNSKIKKLYPDFRATIPFNEGIHQTLQWFDDDILPKSVNNKSNQMIEQIIHAYKNSHIT